MEGSLKGNYLENLYFDKIYGQELALTLFTFFQVQIQNVTRNVQMVDGVIMRKYVSVLKVIWGNTARLLFAIHSA